jgi:pimeloyl-ACP methyl ester carboxylesterase
MLTRRFQEVCLILIGLMTIVVLSSQTFAENALPPEGKFAQINGIDMYYEVYGEGEPLVMLHYFGGSGTIWKPFVPEFSKHYKLVIPDLRGHGRTSILTGTFTHKQSALDVYTLLDQLGIKEFRGIGTSTGGMTLLHMATQQPDRVKAMVVVGATPYWGEPCREILRATNWNQQTPAELEESRKIHKRGDEQIRALVKQFHDFKDSYDDINFTSPYLSTIKARTLIMHGDRDAFFPVDIPVTMYQSIPHSYLWIIPNGGHTFLHDEPHASYSEGVIRFFKGEWEEKNQPR